MWRKLIGGELGGREGCCGGGDGGGAWGAGPGLGEGVMAGAEGGRVGGGGVNAGAGVALAASASVGWLIRGTGVALVASASLGGGIPGAGVAFPGENVRLAMSCTSTPEFSRSAELMPLIAGIARSTQPPTTTRDSVRATPRDSRHKSRSIARLPHGLRIQPWSASSRYGLPE